MAWPSHGEGQGDESRLDGLQFGPCRTKQEGGREGESGIERSPSYQTQHASCWLHAIITDLYSFSISVSFSTPLSYYFRLFRLFLILSLPFSLCLSIFGFSTLNSNSKALYEQERDVTQYIVCFDSITLSLHQIQI